MMRRGSFMLNLILPDIVFLEFQETVPGGLPSQKLGDGYLSTAKITWDVESNCHLSERRITYVTRIDTVYRSNY